MNALNVHCDGLHSSSKFQEYQLPYHEEVKETNEYLERLEKTIQLGMKIKKDEVHVIFK